MSFCFVKLENGFAFAVFDSLPLLFKVDALLKLIYYNVLLIGIRFLFDVSVKLLLFINVSVLSAGISLFYLFPRDIRDITFLLLLVNLREAVFAESLKCLINVSRTYVGLSALFAKYSFVL